MNDQDNQVLCELLLLWEELKEQGVEVSVQCICKNAPHLVSELTKRILAIDTLAWLDAPHDSIMDESTEATAKDQNRVLAGRYRLESLLAEGGFAQVWRAYDLELERFVAVKFPRPLRIQPTEGFIHEARRLAKLSHSGIVPVYDVGREDGSYFIVSELIKGGTLEAKIQSNGYTEWQALGWVIQIADALNYSHEHGIVHQDIKPANILIDENDRAFLTDFGIHRSSLGTGTLRYMSPEQIDGLKIDCRTDIYSLGVVLHELVSGELPYLAGPPTTLRRSILSGVTLGNIPPELQSICRKSLSRDVAYRYQKASQLAADLRCLLDPTPKKGDLWVWLVLFLLLIGMSGLYVSQSSIPISPKILNASGQFVAVAFSPDSKYLLAGELPTSLQLWDLEKEKIVQKFEGFSDWVRCVAYSADGKYVAAGSGGIENKNRELVVGLNNIAILWDVLTGQEVQRYGPLTTPITAIAISPDNQEVVLGSDDGEIRVWDLVTGRIKMQLTGHGPMVRGVQYHPRHHWVVSAGADSTIRIWDLDTANQIQCLKGHLAGVESVACSSDGKWIASGSKDTTVRLWELESGKEIKRFEGHYFPVTSVCFSPDDRMLLSGSFDRTMRLWDISTGKENRLFSGHTSAVNSVACSPNGSRVASGGVDRSLRIWKLR